MPARCTRRRHPEPGREVARSSFAPRTEGAAARPRTDKRGGDGGFALHPVVVGCRRSPRCRGRRVHTREAPLAGDVSVAARSRILRAPRATRGNHGDAVDGAGRQAKVAAGAQRRQHRVHAFRRADDRVDGTGVDAQRAADAQVLVDASDAQPPGFAARPVECAGRASGERRERRDQCIPAGRAAIDRFASGHRLGIGPAAIVPAAPALRLRERIVETVGEGRERMQSHAGNSRALDHRRSIGRGGSRPDGEIIDLLDCPRTVDSPGMPAGQRLRESNPERLPVPT